MTFLDTSTDGETKAFVFQKAEVATLVWNGSLNHYTELVSVSNTEKGCSLMNGLVVLRQLQ